MKHLRSLSEARAFVEEIKKKGLSLGLVPTMGALHDGHISLVRESQKHCDITIVSIFVNPTQFGPNEDFDDYPRILDEDSALLENEGVQAIFAPSAKDMYPEDGCRPTHISVPDLSALYCGASRPQFFDGVCMIVSRLFNCIQADKAFFGEKDFQQLSIIKKMVRDLLIPIQIIGCPLIRETSGVAMSSRNRYLSDLEATEVARIYLGLSDAKKAFNKGLTSSHALIQLVRDILSKNGMIRIDYCVIVNSQTLREEEIATTGCYILVAAWLGKTRLIDNLML
jgi:pantoate--beta-alanine ligase